MYLVTFIVNPSENISSPFSILAGAERIMFEKMKREDEKRTPETKDGFQEQLMTFSEKQER